MTEYEVRGILEAYRKVSKDKEDLIRDAKYIAKEYVTLRGPRIRINVSWYDGKDGFELDLSDPKYNYLDAYNNDYVVYINEAEELIDVGLVQKRHCGCCADEDIASFTLPLSYLWTDDWQKLVEEDKKLAAAKREEAQKAEELRQEEEQRQADLELLAQLKEQYPDS